MLPLLWMHGRAAEARRGVAAQAGGWMGRVYMLDFGTAGIDRFVSLGSPHNPPPKDVPGVVDQTRGILTWVEANCPGAHHDSVRPPSCPACCPPPPPLH